MTVPVKRSGVPVTLGDHEARIRALERLPCRSPDPVLWAKFAVTNKVCSSWADPGVPIQPCGESALVVDWRNQDPSSFYTFGQWMTNDTEDLVPISGDRPDTYAGRLFHWEGGNKDTYNQIRAVPGIYFVRCRAFISDPAIPAAPDWSYEVTMPSVFGIDGNEHTSVLLLQYPPRGYADPYTPIAGPWVYPYPPSNATTEFVGALTIESHYNNLQNPPDFDAMAGGMQVYISQNLHQSDGTPLDWTFDALLDVVRFPVNYCDVDMPDWPS